MKWFFLSMSLLFWTFSFAGEPPPSHVSKECRDFIHSLPSDYRFGWISVPLVNTDPEGKKIDVFWYTKMKSGQHPMIFFYGGPIYDDRFHYLAFANWEDHFNIGMIYMDQRGMGCSSRPADITNEASAIEASFYTSDQMVHDAEAIRKIILGADTKWDIFGQSYGGWLVDRYIALYPSRVKMAFNYGGGFNLDFTEFFYERMKSTIRVTNRFFKDFENSKTLLLEFRNLFKNDTCLQVKERSICGYDLYNEITEVFLGEVSTWETFYDYIKHPRQTIFLEDGSLNPEFMSGFVADNEWALNFFFNRQHYARVLNLWRQEIDSVNIRAFHDDDCRAALAKLESNGVIIDEMPYNHCQKVINSFDPNFKDYLSKTVLKTTVRKTLKFEDVLSGLQANPEIKYFAYSGEFDSMESNEINYKKLVEATNQVTYRQLIGTNHFGYLDRSEFWQDVTQKSVSIFDSNVEWTSNQTKIKVEAQSASGSSPLKNSLSQKAVFIGYADTDLSEDDRINLKGKVALIQRGKVSFGDKVRRAMEAGAVGVIIGNNSHYTSSPFAANLETGVPIPVVMVGTQDFEMLLQTYQLNKSLEFTLSQKYENLNDLK